VVDVVRGDVTRLGDVQKMVEACVAKHGRIDILINNVGMTRAGDPVTMTEEDWDKQLDLNLKSVFLTCKVVLPIMEKQELAVGQSQRGSIVNNASLTAIRYIGKPQIAHASAKAGLVQFTKHTACMWAPRGVRINCIVPGLIHTPLVEGLRISQKPGDNDAYNSITQAKVPLARLGDAFDVANAAVFLCSSAAGYITGHNLVVDGGMSCSAG
jgi:NAD(P)-dependent dehydrogenase (short-subunit alcohol dehydrogenase family)